MGFIPYEQPRGSIHSLETLKSLSDSRCRILCVSDRTLHILLNYAALDIDFQARFADELLENGYLPVDPNSDNWDLYLAIRNAFKLETLDMTCDIENGLLAIADAIRVGGGGGCASPGNVTLNCIVDLSDEQLLGPGAVNQGNPGIDPPPEGFATWEEYFAYKCQAAHFIWEFQRRNMVMIRNFDGVALASSIVAPIAAGLAGVLPAAFTPAGFVVFVGAIIAIGITAAASWWYMDEMIEQWDADKQAIVCALYQSGSSVEAVSALANALEDAIQAIVTWGVLGPVSGEISALLSTMFSQLAGNGMVEPLFKSIAAVVSTVGTVDCDDCGQGYPYAQTSLSSPYNVLTQGESITAYANDPALGYEAENSGTRIDLEFLVDGGYTGLWSWSAEFKCESTPPLTAVVQLEQNTGGGWGSVPDGTWTFPNMTSGWTVIGAADIDINFADSVDYRLHCQPQDYGLFGWYRKFNLKPQ